MNIKILNKYIELCEQMGLEPSFEQLKQFKQSHKKILQH